MVGGLAAVNEPVWGCVEVDNCKTKRISECTSTGFGPSVNNLTDVEDDATVRLTKPSTWNKERSERAQHAANNMAPGTAQQHDELCPILNELRKFHVINFGSCATRN